MNYAFQLSSMVSDLAYIDNFHSLDNYWPYNEVIVNVNETVAKNFNDPPTTFVSGIQEFVRIRYLSALHQLNEEENKLYF